MSMSMLHVQVHVACPCPCCMSMSMLHFHVHAVCSWHYTACPSCMSMLHVHVCAVYPCSAACQWSCCMSCLCCMFMSLLHVLCPCCMSMSMLLANAACPYWISKRRRLDRSMALCIYKLKNVNCWLYSPMHKKQNLYFNNINKLYFSKIYF
jgi:hypothetical protein